MNPVEVTLAERGQIVIPKEARDALGLKPGMRLAVRVEDGRLWIEKRVRLDLDRWKGKAIDDGLTSEQALAELRGRPVPWQGTATVSAAIAPAVKQARKKAGRK